MFIYLLLKLMHIAGDRPRRRIGFLSGMFGVGGGFLMTPMLIFLGVPPAVAVSTEANQIVASSYRGSGALAARQCRF